MEMDPMNAPDTRSASPPKRGGWWRFLLWGILAGGGLLLLFGVFLIAITTPTLRREVPPPVISGPQQISQSSGISDRPTSNTLSVSTSTSGTQSLLDLDDFPHLSPTMRKLAQVWIDRCAETDKALDTITDPALRARAAAYLKDRGKKMRVFLNLALEWDDRPYPKTLNTLSGYNFYNRDEANPDAWNLLLEQCPEFADVFEREHRRASVLRFRLSFEFTAHNQRWNSAAEYCAAADRVSHLDNPDMTEFREMSTWDEEIYCWRQIGPSGLAGLTARSYQRALDDRMQDRQTSPVYQRLRMAGDVVVWTVIMNQTEAESQGKKND